jgi:hypothetical protein
LFGFAHIRREGENRTSGLGAEDDSRETDEELEYRIFTISNTIATIPVDC